MALTYLGLGSNLGNKQQNLNLAVSELILYAGNILKVSSFYETTPWGFASENSFLNAVVLLETNYAPLVLLRKTQEIEKRLGRSKKSDGTYSDRIIDIDILLYDRQVIDLPELKIPHPLMTERDFVLRPLLELTPDLIHPLTGRELVLH
jgi:2-amino-4-hydroxy-6-hydroxymethyldihydropteridine diphosphokinase